MARASGEEGAGADTVDAEVALVCGSTEDSWHADSNKLAKMADLPRPCERPRAVFTIIPASPQFRFAAVTVSALQPCFCPNVP
jgi:hypothetical protein